MENNRSMLGEGSLPTSTHVRGRKQIEKHVLDLRIRNSLYAAATFVLKILSQGYVPKTDN